VALGDFWFILRNLLSKIPHIYKDRSKTFDLHNTEKNIAGAYTDNVKVQKVKKSNCLIYTKSGNVIRKSGKIRGNYQKNRENRNFRI